MTGKSQTTAEPLRITCVGRHEERDNCVVVSLTRCPTDAEILRLNIYLVGLQANGQ